MEVFCEGGCRFAVCHLGCGVKESHCRALAFSSDYAYAAVCLLVEDFVYRIEVPAVDSGEHGESGKGLCKLWG